MRKDQLSEADARTIQVIIDDAVMRLDAVAERGGYPIAQVRGSAAGGLALKALRAGQCKTELLSGMDEVLRCNCQIKTKGSA